MGVYDDDIEMVLELIAESGQVCDWFKDAVTFTDPDAPWKGGVTAPVAYQPSIVFVPQREMGMYGLVDYLKGTEVVQYDTYGLMGPGDFTPETTDRVLRGGVPLVVKNINTIQPNEQIILYILGIG